MWHASLLELSMQLSAGERSGKRWASTQLRLLRYLPVLSGSSRCFKDAARKRFCRNTLLRMGENVSCSSSQNDLRLLYQNPHGCTRFNKNLDLLAENSSPTADSEWSGTKTDTLCQVPSFAILRTSAF